MTTKSYSFRNRLKTIPTDETKEDVIQLKTRKRTAKRASLGEVQETSPAKSNTKEKKPKKKVSFAVNLVEVEGNYDRNNAIDAKSEENGSSSPRWKIDDSFKLSDCLTEVSWKTALNEEMDAKYFAEMEEFLKKQIQNGHHVFPSLTHVFRAFELTPLVDVKVVILGQDPYHDDGQADGLAFSVRDEVALPRSLKNIFTELERDIDGFTCPSSGSLVEWAKRGVFLLNASLTVRAHEPNSHYRIGWQTFTDAVIKLISDRLTGVVFILWGGFAHKKAPLIDESKHDVIKTFHPSPQSLNKFSGCRCFSKANVALAKFGRDPIDWRL